MNIMNQRNLLPFLLSFMLLLTGCGISTDLVTEQIPDNTYDQESTVYVDEIEETQEVPEKESADRSEDRRVGKECRL